MEFFTSLSGKLNWPIFGVNTVQVGKPFEQFYQTESFPLYRFLLLVQYQNINWITKDVKVSSFKSVFILKGSERWQSGEDK